MTSDMTSIAIAKPRIIACQHKTACAVALVSIVTLTGSLTGVPAAQIQVPAKRVERNAVGRLHPPYSVDVAGPFDGDGWPGQPVSIIKDGAEIGSLAIRPPRFDIRRQPMMIQANTFHPTRILALYEGAIEQKREVAILEAYRDIDNLPFVESRGGGDFSPDPLEPLPTGQDGLPDRVSVRRDDRSGIYVLYDGALDGLPRVIFGQSVDPRAATLNVSLDLVKPNGATQVTGMTLTRSLRDREHDRYEIAVTRQFRDDGPTATQMAVTAVFLSQLSRRPR